MLPCLGSSTEWTGGTVRVPARSHLYTNSGVSSRRVPASPERPRFVDADACFWRTAHEVDHRPRIGSGKEVLIPRDIDGVSVSIKPPI